MQKVEVIERRLKGSTEAIQKLGGASATKRLMNEYIKENKTGHDELTTGRVQKWMMVGCFSIYCPILHHLSGVPLWKLDPWVYPRALFK